MKILHLLVLIIIASSCGDRKNKPVSRNKSLPQVWKEERKDQPVTPEGPCLQITLVNDAEVVFLNASNVSSPISGTVESIAGEGTVFKKGDLLIQLDNRAAFAELVSQKEKFIAAARAVSEKHTQNSDWKDFLSKLDRYKLLPQLPETANPENDERQLISKYESVNKLEAQMRNHFIIAQTDGTVLTQNYKAGETVKNGETLLRTGKSVQKAFRLPENYGHSGNATLVSKETGQRYQVTTDRQKSWIKVKKTVPVGKYTLKQNVSN